MSGEPYITLSRKLKGIEWDPNIPICSSVDEELKWSDIAVG
jgi:hypothetical protein